MLLLHVFAIQEKT